MEKVKNFLTGGSSKKDHVDPYFVFSFGGNVAQSEVKEQNASPEWNEELRVPLQFPPISDKITLQVRNALFLAIGNGTSPICLESRLA